MLKMTERKDIISVYDGTQSVRATAKQLGLNRKTVKRYVDQYLRAASEGDESLTVYLKSEPVSKGSGTERVKRALTAEVRSQIEAFLKDNREKRARGDRKLCMKAIDMHQELLRRGYTVSYPSVCNYIRKHEGIESGIRECYIRQDYVPGMDCEFDWGELHLTIDGERRKVYIAVFTLAYSNYRMAFLFFRQDTQAFIESHKLCFDIFTGVPGRMVYDNMRLAVRTFVGGKQPTDALIRMERAWGFTHRFCNVRSGNEKGHVERSVEFVRRKAFATRDSFESLDEANRHLYDTCMDLNMTISSPATADIIRKSAEDLATLLPLREGPGSFEHGFYTVDKYATVNVKGAHYSVPETLVGKKVSVFVHANRISVRHAGKEVACHERREDHGWHMDLMHYLATFEYKPGSVAGSAALACAAPEIQEVFRNHFLDNPRRFVDLLRMLRENDLTLEDFIVAYDMMMDSGINPSAPGAFEQMLLPQYEAPRPIGFIHTESNEIERHSMATLSALTSIMNNTSTTYNTDCYERTKPAKRP